MAAIVDQLKMLPKYAPEKPEHWLGKGLMIPCNNHNAASRKKMFNVHTDHRTDLIDPEIAYMDTGYSNEYGRYNSAVLTSDMDYEVVAKISKFSHIPNHDYILVLKSKTGNNYRIYNRKFYNYITETNGYLYNNSFADNLSVGSSIRKGDVIRKTTSYDDAGNKRDGCGLLTTFMNMSKNCEDGIILSEAVRKKFDSPVFKPVRRNINNNVVPLNLYGNNGNYKVCPFVGEDVKDGILMGLRLSKNEEMYYSQNQDRLRKIFISDKKITIGNGTVVDCDIYCNDPDTLYSRPEYTQLAMIYQNQMRFSREIVQVLGSIIADTNNTVSYELEDLYLKHKRILDGQPFLNENESQFSFIVIDFVVYDISRIQIGDKITNRCGGKGVVSGFIPEEEMPLLDNGLHVECIANSAGIVGRLNPTQKIEMESNMISSRIIEYIRAGLSSGEIELEEAFVEYFKFLSYVCPREELYIRSCVDNMTYNEKEMFMQEIISHDSIYFNPEPISESYGIDLLDKLYKAFPYVDSYDVVIAMRDSNNQIRYLNTRRKLVAGSVYYYRLKQHAEEKFSVTSLSATNIRNQNTRSRSSKIYEAPFSRTPVSFGNMEISNLEHLNPEVTIVMLLLNSASPHGRRLSEKLLKEDPYNVSIEPDKNTINVSAEIAHVYLKAIGIRMIFKKKLLELIHPAYIMPGRVANRKITDADNFITPAYYLTEKEKEVYGDLIKPAYVDSYISPADITPAIVVPRVKE